MKAKARTPERVMLKTEIIVTALHGNVFVSLGMLTTMFGLTPGGADALAKELRKYARTARAQGD